MAWGAAIFLAQVKLYLEKAAGSLYRVLEWESTDRTYTLVFLIEAKEGIGIVMGMLKAAKLLNLENKALD